MFYFRGDKQVFTHALFLSKPISSRLSRVVCSDILTLHTPDTISLWIYTQYYIYFYKLVINSGQHNRFI